MEKETHKNFGPPLAAEDFFKDRVKSSHLHLAYYRKVCKLNLINVKRKLSHVKTSFNLLNLMSHAVIKFPGDKS